MYLKKGPGDVQPLARMLSLRGDAALAHARQQLGKLMGETRQLVIDGVILNALKNLVVPVKPAPKAVMRAPPHSRT